MANFCAAKASAPPIDPDLEYGRDTMTQPYCDWTHALEAVTIIGLWSNVPSGGHLYPQQVAWLTAEIKAAPVDRPLIVQLHHPPYSVDAHHGGSAKMGAALDGAFVAAGRWPELVLSGHVHDAQFFTRKRPGGTTTYVVIGNSGYHNTHPLAGDYAPNMDVLGDGSVICNYGDASGWGFLVLALIDGKIHGEYVQVAKEGTVTHRAYEFIA
jgi:3',5'-cyclic AMP phosphodiesterase CpdA